MRVENRKLIFNVARFLKKCGVKIIRGHAYKPLTFPYRSKKYLESMEEGMNWMDEVKKYFNLKVVTEVTEIRHLDKLIKQQIFCKLAQEICKTLVIERNCINKKTHNIKRTFWFQFKRYVGCCRAYIS